MVSQTCAFYGFARLAIHHSIYPVANVNPDTEVTNRESRHAIRDSQYATSVSGITCDPYTVRAEDMRRAPYLSPDPYMGHKPDRAHKPDTHSVRYPCPACPARQTTLCLPAGECQACPVQLECQARKPCKSAQSKSPLDIQSVTGTLICARRTRRQLAA